MKHEQIDGALTSVLTYIRRRIEAARSSGSNGELEALIVVEQVFDEFKDALKFEVAIEDT